jgi:CHAD domain-containing protein
VFGSSKSALRDAGRALSSARDAKVIADRYAEMLRRAGIEAIPVSTIVESQPLTEHNAARRRRSDVVTARTGLAAMRTRLATAPLSATDWTPLGRGIRAIYRRSRRATPGKSAGAASTETWHEWRKRVKDYLHALEVVVAPGRSSPVRRTISSARRLADVLGEEHDLVLLADALRASAESQDARIAELLDAIRLRRHRLRRRARRTGARLYAETPAAIEKQLRRAER